MPVNLDKPHLWKADIAQSVDYYNAWFIAFAPETYRSTRAATAQRVEASLKATKNLADVAPEVLRANPGASQILRMATAPSRQKPRLILCGPPAARRKQARVAARPRPRARASRYLSISR